MSFMSFMSFMCHAWSHVSLVAFCPCDPGLPKLYMDSAGAVTADKPAGCRWEGGWRMLEEKVVLSWLESWLELKFMIELKRIGLWRNCGCSVGMHTPQKYTDTEYQISWIGVLFASGNAGCHAVNRNFVCFVGAWYVFFRRLLDGWCNLPGQFISTSPNPIGYSEARRCWRSLHRAERRDAHCIWS